MIILLLMVLLVSGLDWWWRSAPKLVAESRQMETNTPLLVAAAADLDVALSDLDGEFKRRSGVDVRVTLGASGTLYSQMVNGAPFDVFLSADSDYPRRLEEARMVRGKVKDYAVGHIVLWFRGDMGKTGVGPELLLSKRVRRIAIANPEHAPYGQAAVAALKSLHLYEQIRPKLVMGENISQTAQFALSGNVEAAVLPLTTAMSSGLRGIGSYWTVPQEDYPVHLQSAAVLASSTNQAAPEYLQFVLSPEGQAILRRHGFAPATEEDR